MGWTRSSWGMPPSPLLGSPALVSVFVFRPKSHSSLFGKQVDQLKQVIFPYSDFLKKIANISTTMHRSETVLYSEQTGGKILSSNPLSPHIKTIAVAFLQAE